MLTLMVIILQATLKLGLVVLLVRLGLVAHIHRLRETEASRSETLIIWLLLLWEKWLCLLNGHKGLL